MPYISADGTVGGSRDYFSVQGLIGLFWGIVNFFSLFLRTLISPSDNKRGQGYSSNYRSPGGWPGGPGGAPRRRMGGFGRGPGGAGPPPMAGGG